MELRMDQLLQTAVELPRTTKHTSCRVQQSLQLVSSRPGTSQRPLYQCHSRLCTECTPDVSNLTKIVKADRADVGNMLLNIIVVG